MLDVHSKIVSFLKSKSLLNDSVSGRIFAIDIPHKVPFPALAIKRDGGGSTNSFLETKFEILVYSESDIEADRIDGYLRDVMTTLPSQTDLSDYNINWINIDILGQPVFFPDYNNIKIRMSFYTIEFLNE